MSRAIVDVCIFMRQSHKTIQNVFLDEPILISQEVLQDCCCLNIHCIQWHSQIFSDGRAHYSSNILSTIYKHAGLYVHLLKGVVCMKMHTNSS